MTDWGVARGGDSPGPWAVVRVRARARAGAGAGVVGCCFDGDCADADADADGDGNVAAGVRADLSVSSGATVYPCSSP